MKTFHARVMQSLNRAGLTDMHGQFYEDNAHKVTKHILAMVRGRMKRASRAPKAGLYNGRVTTEDEHGFVTRAGRHWTVSSTVGYHGFGADCIEHGKRLMREVIR